MEAERALPASLQLENVTDDEATGATQHDNRSYLSLRGTIFEVDIESLRIEARDKNSKLATLATKWKNMKRCEKINSKDLDQIKVNIVYFDKNPAFFHCVLDYYQTGVLNLPDGVCGEQLRREMIYWGLEKRTVAPCCKKNIQEGLDMVEKMTDILKGQERLSVNNDVRHRIWSYFDNPFNTKLGMLVFCLSFAIHLLFMMTFAIDSMPRFRVPISNCCNTTGEMNMGRYLQSTKLDPELAAFELALLCLIFMTIIMKCILRPDKHNLRKEPSEILSLIGLFIQWIYVVHEVFFLSCAQSVSALRYLKPSKLLLIAPLLKPFRSIYIVQRALIESCKELLMLGALLSMSAVIFGYLVYMCEVRENGSQFRTSTDGIWWGFVTLTTVGYGDFYPKTLPGKILGTLCAFVGILVIALPIPIIARNFTKIYDLMEIVDYQKTKDRGNKVEDTQV